MLQIIRMLSLQYVVVKEFTLVLKPSYITLFRREDSILSVFVFVCVQNKIGLLSTDNLKKLNKQDEPNTF